MSTVGSRYQRIPEFSFISKLLNYNFNAFLLTLMLA
jgi:hypothetical protein